jgi:Protein of unknown function (DUF5132)
MALEEPVPTRRSPRRFGTIVTALIAGFAGGLLAPLVLPGLERNLRPATKRAFKTGIALYERGRERAAEIGEMAGDLMAEARAEYDAEQGIAGVVAEAVAENEVVKLRRGRSNEVDLPNA